MLTYCSYRYLFVLGMGHTAFVFVIFFYLGLPYGLPPSNEIEWLTCLTP